MESLPTVQKRGMPEANRNAVLILGLALLGLMLFLGFMMINLQLRLNRMDREAMDSGLVQAPTHCVFCARRLSPIQRSRLDDRCASCAASQPKRHFDSADKPDDIDVEKQNAHQTVYEVRN